MFKSYSTLLFLSTIFFSCSSISQIKYKVQSIDSVPGIKHYILKLDNRGELFTVISAYSYEYLSLDNSEKLSKGTEISIYLKKVEKKNNPFRIPNTRRPDLAIYIDGKLFYNPKESLYYSDCINGLQYIKNCK